MTVRPAATTATAGLLGEMETIEPRKSLVRYVEVTVSRGMSMRMALAAYRAGGGRIRTDDFARLWRAEHDRVAKVKA